MTYEEARRMFLVNFIRNHRSSQMLRSSLFHRSLWVHYLGGMKGDEESLFLFGPSTTRTTGDNDQNIIIIFH